MNEMTLAIAALAGAAVMLVTYGLRLLSTAEAGVIGDRVDRTSRQKKSTGLPAAALRTPRANNAFNSFEEPLKGKPWADRTRHALERADVHLMVSEYVALRLAITGLAVAPSLLLLPGALGLAAAFILGLLAWMLPPLWLKQRAAHRQSALESQLDAALVNIAGALKAGFSFLQACQITLPQLQWPLRDDLSAALEETQLGATIEDAFAGMGRRIQSYDFDIVVNAVLIQRAVGGNLAEILDGVAHTIRERRELKGHIMALTAQQRLSAIFCTAIPVFMGGFLTLISPEFMRPLWTTTLGNILIGVGLVMDALGFVVMRKLTRIDF